MPGRLAMVWYKDLLDRSAQGFDAWAAGLASPPDSTERCTGIRRQRRPTARPTAAQITKWWDGPSRQGAGKGCWSWRQQLAGMTRLGMARHACCAPASALKTGQEWGGCAPHTVLVFTRKARWEKKGCQRRRACRARAGRRPAPGRGRGRTGAGGELNLSASVRTEPWQLVHSRGGGGGPASALRAMNRERAAKGRSGRADNTGTG